MRGLLLARFGHFSLDPCSLIGETLRRYSKSQRFHIESSGIFWLHRRWRRGFRLQTTGARACRVDPPKTLDSISEHMQYARIYGELI